MNQLYWPLSKTGMARLCSCVARVGENFLLVFSRKQTGLRREHIGHKIPFWMDMTEAELHEERIMLVGGKAFAFQELRLREDVEA